jgi:hypothetical protein
MTNYKDFFIGLILFLVAQSLAWYQTNGQFINNWMKDNPIIVSGLFGIPVGLGYIYGTSYTVSAFNGTLWSARLIGFATGVSTFALLTYLYMNEGINIKTGVILLLAVTIVLLQVFWKVN